MKIKNFLRPGFIVLVLCLGMMTVSSCASTGPKVSKAEKKLKEEEFNAKFLKATGQWNPRIYRIGYRLLTSPVPGFASEKPKFNFAGISVIELKDYARKAYGISESVKGVLVLGTYPGSKAENLDLQPGDVIEKLDGKKVKNLGKYFKIIRKTDHASLKAGVLRKGQTLQLEVPIEKVYYNAQFFLAATPDLDAHAAFSKIGVGIGAIRYCRNDDELAVIMGHELAHTTLKHSLKKMGAGVASSLAYGVLAGTIDAFTVGGVGNLILNPAQQATDAAVSRRYEREADYFGMQHSFHAGYDVASGSKVFARLATDAPSFTLLAYTFASHPKSSERFLRLEKMVEEFKTKFPDKFKAIKKSEDWEMVIPVQTGESLEEALNQLLEQQKKVSPPLVTTNETNKANLASPDTYQASGYPVPKK